MLEMMFRFAVPAFGVRIHGERRNYRLVPRDAPPELGEAYIVVVDGHEEMRADAIPGPRIENLSDHPALFMEFAEMQETAKAVEVFVNNYGTIGLASQDDFLLNSPIHHFPRQAQGITWETDEFSHINRWFPDLRKMKEQVKNWLEGRLPDPDFVAPSTRSGLLARGTVCHVASHAGTIRLVFVPDRLLDALWVQFALAISRKAQFRRCEFMVCGKWFEVGQGSGKRSHARFCREKCRKDFHNHHREDSK